MRRGVLAANITDYHELQFWLFAFKTNVAAFLHATHARRRTIRPSAASQRMTAAFQWRLAHYHLALTIGSLIRRLDRFAPLFPSIQAAYAKATHLRKEGPDFRDMIEHVDDYFEGEGNKQDKFFVSGDYFKDQELGGYWLGRLNLNRVIKEVEAISVAVKNTAPPPPPSPQQRRQMLLARSGQKKAPSS
jgi:hypothetical protein